MSAISVYLLHKKEPECVGVANVRISYYKNFPKSPYIKTLVGSINGLNIVSDGLEICVTHVWTSSYLGGLDKGCYMHM